MRGRRWVKPDPRKKSNWIEPSEEEQVVRALAGDEPLVRKIPWEQGRRPWRRIVSYDSAGNMVVVWLITQDVRGVTVAWDASGNLRVGSNP